MSNTQQFQACPSCNNTRSKFGKGSELGAVFGESSELGIYRCSCGKVYCDKCSAGGLITLPRCPVSVSHEGMKKISVVNAQQTSEEKAETAPSDPGFFECKKCGRTTDHARLNDQYAGELWQCESCGWKTIRDESKSWAKVRSEYRGSSFEEIHRENMRGGNFQAVVHHMVLCMAGEFREFTAAEKSRICAIIIENWNESNEDIATSLKDAGFSLEGGMSPPAEYVARIKNMGEKEYQKKMSKKWWQFWR